MSEGAVLCIVYSTGEEEAVPQLDRSISAASRVAVAAPTVPSRVITLFGFVPNARDRLKNVHFNESEKSRFTS